LKGKYCILGSKGCEL